MAQTYNLGKVSLTPRGTFNATSTYNALDIVSYNGSGYIVLQAVTGVTPPNPTYYQVIASKGDSGEDGSAATVTAGSIAMLPLGSNPTVTNAGTLNSAVFNFGIPYSPVADGSVGTTKIVDGAVTTNKISDGAVGTGKISNGAISYSKLGADTKALLTNIEDIVADAFNATSSYSAGDYAIYGTNDTNIALYRFIADKDAGSWDVTKVIQVSACDEISGKVDSESLNDAGIHDRTYVTEVDSTTVTTVYTDLHPSYYAYVAERGDNLVRGHMYRITFDGTEYIVPALRWFWSGTDGSTFWSKGVTFIGDLSLFCDTSGFYGELPDVPFLFTNIYSLFPLVNDKIFLFTETQGSHTVKIERIDYDMTLVPNSLVWDNEIKPIYEKKEDNVESNYTGICVGLNDMKNRKSTVAVGWNNTMNAQAGAILGSDNLVSGQAGIAVGNRNQANAAGASAFGYNTIASGNYAESHGYNSSSSGTISTTHGFRTIANHKSQFSFGEYNVADDSTANANSRGNYVEIVGNGTDADNRSNARTLDWNGNESLAGGITLGKGTADEVSLSAAQLKRLLALLT